jgi:tetratricopeptide (TPR) repeat protein
MKLYDEAIESYNAATTLSPMDYRSYFQLGLAYRDKNDFNKSASSFEKSLQINDKQVEAHEELGMIYYRNLKDNRKAVFHFEKVISMQPNHPDADKIQNIINLIKK